MLDLIQVQIVFESGHNIKEEHQEMIFAMRTPETLKGLWKAHQDPNTFKKQMSFIKEVCLRDIMHLEVLSPFDDDPSLVESD